MTNYFFKHYRTRLVGAFFGVMVFGLTAAFGQIARAGTAVSSPPEIFTSDLVVSDANCESATAKLPVADEALIYIEYNSQGEIVSEGQLTTDSSGLATAAVKDNTVTKIQFVYSDTVSTETTISCQPTGATIISKTIAGFFAKAAAFPIAPVVATVVAAILTIAAITATAFPGLGLGSLFSLILSFPSALGIRPKRRGIVFDASSLRPVPGVIVQLFHASNSKLAAIARTNKYGHYFFKVRPGEYFITAKKNGFAFPTRILTDSDQDTKYYTGQKIVISVENTIIDYLIPIDPSAIALDPDEPIKRLILYRPLRVFLIILAAVFVIYSLNQKDSTAGFISLTVLSVLSLVEYSMFEQEYQHRSFA